jgi:hypothetical protein
MCEAQFFHVKFVYVCIDEFDWALFCYVLVDGVWEDEGLLSGYALYVLDHLLLAPLGGVVLGLGGLVYYD